MAKDNNQTTTETEELENKEQQQTQETTEEKEDKANTAKAVKSSKDFDELIDKEGVDEAPSDETVSTDEGDKNKQKPEAEKAESDDKDTGKKAETDEGKSEQPEVDEYKVSEELAKKAIDLGLTEEEVAQFDSDEELQKTVTIIESISNEPEERQSAQPAAKKDEKTEKDDSVLKFENEEDIDPELLKAMKNMEKHYKSQISELRETVNAMQQQGRKAQQGQFIKRFDSMIDKLGLDFADVFGKGPTTSLSKRSVAYRNRDAVRARMYAFGKGFVEAQQSVPDEQQLFDLALHSLHGKKIEDVKNAARSTKAKSYAKGAKVGRPASKSAGNLTPHQKAVETSKNFDALIDTSED